MPCLNAFNLLNGKKEIAKSIPVDSNGKTWYEVSFPTNIGDSFRLSPECECDFSNSSHLENYS